MLYRVMDDQTIKGVVEELAPVLIGRPMGKVFQLSRATLAIDFRLSDSRYLFISVEPNQPRIYLIERTVREMEKGSLTPSPFVFVLRKHLSRAILQAITKDEGDRIVRLSFQAQDAIGDTRALSLIAQLTGRTANLFLLDEAGRIVDSLRPSQGTGQEIGSKYERPPQSVPTAPSQPTIRRGIFNSLSEAADEYYRQLEAARAFDARAAALSSRVRQGIEKRRKLRRNLESDLAAHGDAEKHKQMGELLLANISTAERHGPIVRIKDYYSEDAPIIELEIDESSTLQEEAARRFARYAKAKRAAEEITQRIRQVEKEIETLEAQRAELERIIAERDETALRNFDDESREGSARTKLPRVRYQEKTKDSISGARRYRSSDGYEILVGRAAKDNDHLTFRVARPFDIWLHAADYPGSHVVVRNPTRGEVPHRTIIEAAQLAANFSQARRDAKVAVHYTQRKFLSKPKGAAPGLVRMSSFRTLMVEPRETAERI